jgi:hypothetical protein
MASILDLELDNIRNTLLKMYNELLTKAFQEHNPEHTPEELEDFLSENSLEPSETEDLEGLMDVLDPVTEMSMEDSPKEHRGIVKKSEKHESGDIPTTIAPELPMGMFRKAAESLQKAPSSGKTPEAPKGPVKRSKTHEGHNIIDKISLERLLDKERQRLLRVVEKRNKEFGVVL